MKIELQIGDITQLSVDAIVNAANSSLMGGGGVDGAIHRVGGSQILEQCIEIRKQHGHCEVGEAVITDSGNLPAKKVIHTVGPYWNGGEHNEAQLLKSCYINSLKLAEIHGLKSIAFPNISTGVFRYPKKKAAVVAIKSVKEYALTTNININKVIFICFDGENHHLYQRYLPLL